MRAFEFRLCVERKEGALERVVAGLKEKGYPVLVNDLKNPRGNNIPNSILIISEEEPWLVEEPESIVRGEFNKLAEEHGLLYAQLEAKFQPL